LFIFVFRIHANIYQKEEEEKKKNKQTNKRTITRDSEIVLLKKLISTNRSISDNEPWNKQIKIQRLIYYLARIFYT